MLNPIVQNFIHHLKGENILIYLMALGDDKTNQNWKFYVNYGLEF